MGELEQINHIRARAEGWRVAEALGLQRWGMRYVCPACGTPDLHVSERHFTCHGCSQHGDLIALVMVARHCSLQDAAAWLAQQGMAAADQAPAEAEQRIAEQEWLETEQRFQAIFEQAAVGLALASPNGQWLLVNQQLCEITGYTQAELLGRTFQDITYPGNLPADLDHVRQVLAGDIANCSLELRYVRKDGNLVWVNLTVSLVREPSGAPKYFVAVIQDITARKWAEQLLATAYRVSYTLLEASNPDYALGRALQIIGEGLDWQVGLLWCVERDHRLHCTHTWHHASAEVGQFLAASQSMSYLPGQGRIGRVWATGQPEWIADVRNDTIYRRRHAAITDYLHGFSAFPLRGDRGILGVIEFACYEIRPPDEQLLQAVTTIGTQIGQFLEKKGGADGPRETEPLAHGAR